MKTEAMVLQSNLNAYLGDDACGLRSCKYLTINALIRESRNVAICAGKRVQVNAQTASSSPAQKLRTS